tara:strand:+ start:2080 stop:2292 length:213 start_codon:yes stop_codon:yes gene_type:complete
MTKIVTMWQRFVRWMRDDKTKIITIQLSERTFEKCVGRPPKDDEEMEKFAELWEEYEWEDLICGGWDEYF